MALRIVNKNSTVQDKAPVAGDLQVGEIAINANVNSPAAYIKDSAGNIVKLAGAGSVGDDWTRTGTALAPKTAGDTLQFSAGTAALPGITPVGDTNTGIYSPGADQVAISSNSSERLRVDSSGRLGLGTSTPSAVLDVSGNSKTSTLQIGTNPAGVNIGVLGIPNQKRIYGRNVANTGDVSILYINGSNGMVFGPNDAAVIDSSGRLGIGNNAPGSTLTVKGSTGVTPLQISGPSSEFVRCDSIGRVLVGTSSATGNIRLDQKLTVVTAGSGLYGGASLVGYTGTNSFNRPILDFKRSRGTTDGSMTSVASGDDLGVIAFFGSDGNQFRETASINCAVDGTPGANDMPGRLVFSTTADGASSPTERMRIDNGGRVLINTTSSVSSGNAQIEAYNATDRVMNCKTGVTSNVFQISFNNPNGLVGSISTNASATAYNTSSDYRLKENVVLLTGAADRLKQIPVHRFNFIADPDKTVDGFLAHEAQAVVPECVTGTKDEVDDEGNPVYQGIDQSKLVPLLTAALQEALQKIKDLETRLTAAGL